MLCEEVLELMMPYFDKELDNVTKARINGHLEACEKCREEYKIMHSILSESCKIGENPPKELCDGVMVSIKAKNRRLMFRALPGTALAAAIVIAVGLNFNNIMSLLNNKNDSMKISGAAANAVSEEITEDYSQEDTTGSVQGSTATKSTTNDSAAASSTSSSSDSKSVSVSLPFGVADVYKLENVTFKYGYLIDYNTGIQLAQRDDIAILVNSDIPLLQTKLSMDELDKLLKELNINVLNKSADYSAYSGLVQNAEYGFIMLSK